MMSNEELIKVLNGLKLDGVSYKYIAKLSDISYDTFYYYRRCKQFPLCARIKIEESLNKHFGEVLDEYRQ